MRLKGVCVCVNVTLVFLCLWVFAAFSLALLEPRWYVVVVFPLCLMCPCCALNQHDYSASVGWVWGSHQPRQTLIICERFSFFSPPFPIPSFISLFFILLISSHHILSSVPTLLSHCSTARLPRLGVNLQPNVREAHLRDRELVAPSLPGQPVCVLPDPRACVFRHGVHGGRRPDDAHSYGCLHRTTSHVRSVKTTKSLSSSVWYSYFKV